MGSLEGHSSTTVPAEGSFIGGIALLPCVLPPGAVSDLCADLCGSSEEEGISLSMQDHDRSNVNSLMNNKCLMCLLGHTSLLIGPDSY